MNSKLTYFISGILVLAIIAATTAPMWQPPRHDATMIGVGTDDEPLGVDFDTVAKANLTNFNGSKLTIQKNALGITQSDSYGLLLENTTAAANGAQQISPSIHWSGRGWKSNATAESQDLSYRADVVPFQGTDSPKGMWRLMSKYNNVDYVQVFGIGTNGQIYLGGAGGIGTIGEEGNVLISGGPNNPASWTEYPSPPSLDNLFDTESYLGGSRRIPTNNLFSIGDFGATSTGTAFWVDPTNLKIYADNTSHEIRLGVNTDDPQAELDIHGKAKINSVGQTLIGDIDNTTYINFNGSGGDNNIGVFGKFVLATTHTPSSATDAGITGQIAWDGNFIYVCVSTDTWVRTALATW